MRTKGSGQGNQRQRIGRSNDRLGHDEPCEVLCTSLTAICVIRGSAPSDEILASVCIHCRVPPDRVRSNRAAPAGISARFAITVNDEIFNLDGLVTRNPVVNN